MFKLTNDVQYKNKFQEFKSAIAGTPTTPGGMVFIQQWGSARHAANAAFLHAVGAKITNDNADLQWAKECHQKVKNSCVFFFWKKTRYL